MNAEATTTDTARGLAENLANSIEDAGKAEARKARNAERARERRAAKKTPEREATREVVIDGQTYTVAASMTEDEGMKVAQLLHSAYLDRTNGTPDDAEAAKPPKPVKVKGDPLATVFYRLSRTAMEALEGKLGAEYRKENPKDWKVLKASKRVTGGQSWAFTGKLRPEAASALAAALRSIAATEGFTKPGSLITNAEKLESNHYVTKAAEKR